ncbi:MAG: hypothetical protein QM778_02865 [Myxococcales bacterium]
MSAPDVCPCCHGELAKASARCRRCTAAVGEENRCPRCHAYAAVIERSSGYHCGACGAPRERMAQTQCLSDAELLQALEPRPPQRHALWAALAALPFLIASLALRSVLPEMRWLLALAGGFVLLCVFAYRQRSRRLQERRRAFEIEQRIIGLAYQTDGVLREQEVSTRLRISLVEARLTLEELARQERAVAYGQGHAVSEFRFGEARRTRAIRRRSPPPKQDQSS